MSNTTTYKEIEINLGDLVDSGLSGFRRAYAFMGFAVNMVNHPDLINFEVPVTFSTNNQFPVTVDTSDVTPEILKQYREGFVEWVIGNGLQELVEQFSLFLDDVYYYLQCAGPNPKRSQIESKMTSFENKNMHAKLKEFTKLNVATQLLSGFETLVKARNCLVHRGGIVGKGVQGKRDFNDTSLTERRLTLKWKVLEPIILMPNGEKEAFLQSVSDIKYPIGSRIEFSVADRIKTFEEGQKINFSAEELSEICLNFRSAAGEILCKFFEILMTQGQLPVDDYNKLLAIVKDRISIIGAIYMKPNTPY